MSDRQEVVIRSMREDGGKFRPSDWIERISSSLASFGADQRLNYSRNAQPCVIQGEKCLVVQRGLAEADPAAFKFIMDFARSNRLCIVEDRRQMNTPVAQERRRA